MFENIKNIKDVLNLALIVMLGVLVVLAMTYTKQTKLMCPQVEPNKRKAIRTLSRIITGYIIFLLILSLIIAVLLQAFTKYASDHPDKVEGLLSGI